MYAAFIKGLLLGMMLAISVGPVIFSIIKQSINSGHKGGFTFVAGVSSSDITMVVISQLFTELFRSLLGFKKEIGIGGSILLIVIGLFVLFFKKVKVNEDGTLKQEMRKRDYLKIFLSGYFMNTLNPSVIAFWLVIATSVVGYSFGYRLTMFITCLSFVLLSDIAKVFLAGKIRDKLTAKNIHIINQVSGIILIGFGLALIWGTLEFGEKLH
jgi:threonine/homoserine/homoserine lactone efflux protein